MTVEKKKKRLAMLIIVAKVLCFILDGNDWWCTRINITNKSMTFSDFISVLL